MHSPSRADVVAEARSFLGVPWRHQGRTRNGLDCAGLIIVVGNNLKLIDYDTPSYQRNAKDFDFLNRFKENMKEKSLLDLNVGDVVILHDRRFPCHCGFIGRDKRQSLTLVHAVAERRQVVEHDYSTYQSRAVACFEFYGVGT